MSRVFISWSGNRSRRLAEALRDWLPTIIQATDPFVSSWDIGAGSDWLSEIRGKLEEAKCGIVCATRENLQEPWLLFEAGALAKHLGNPVCLVLLDLEPSGVAPPLSIFQASRANRDGIERVLKTINGTTEKPLSDETLGRMLDRGWSELEAELANIAEGQAPEERKSVRDDRALLEEMLEHVRTLTKRGGTSQNYDFRMSPSETRKVRQAITMNMAGSGTPVTLRIEEFLSRLARLDGSRIEEKALLAKELSDLLRRVDLTAALDDGNPE